MADIGNEEEATRWERGMEGRKGLIELEEEEGYVPAKMRPFRKTRLSSLPHPIRCLGLALGLGAVFKVDNDAAEGRN